MCTLKPILRKLAEWIFTLLDDTEIYRNGAWTALDPSAIYKVLVNTWTSSGGDGYYILLGADIPKENTTMFTADILASYIQRHSPVSPKIEGRISFIDK